MSRGALAVNAVALAFRVEGAHGGVEPVSHFARREKICRVGAIAGSLLRGGLDR